MLYELCLDACGLLAGIVLLTKGREGSLTAMFHRLRFVCLCVFAVWVSWVCADAQRVIHVPADVPTIQQAIGMASNGDTVSIAPGTYGGSIDFDGKAITVQGAASGVIIQGSKSGPVVLFRHGEGRGSVLENVTVQGGASSASTDAGGVVIDHASPTVRNATITSNSDCGIGVHSGAPLITGNTITLNDGGRVRGCIPLVLNLGVSGGGITLEGTPAGGQSAVITGNIIAQNTAVWSAAGITAFDAGHLVIANNVITANTSNGQGSALALVQDTSAEIMQNLIYANVLNPTLSNPAYADTGAGLNLDLTVGSQHGTRTVVVNNTIAENVLIPVTGARIAGSQVVVLNAYDSISFYNNVIASDDALSAVDCKRSVPQPIPLPVFDHTLVSTQGTAASSFSADCTSPAGSNGNLFADPMFVARNGNAPYQMAKGSPAIDSGNNNAPSLLQTDLLGQNRLQNATGTPSAIIDRGVYEAAGVGGTLPPPTAGLSIRVNPASLSLQPVSSGVVQVTATVTGALAGPVLLSCANLPAHATCSFEQNSLAINGAGTYSTDMTLAVSNATASTGESWGVVTALMVPGMLFGLRRRSRLAALLVLLVSCGVFFVSGCKTVVSTIPASYNVTVVGTDSASGKSAQAALPVTVTP